MSKNYYYSHFKKDINDKINQKMENWEGKSRKLGSDNGQHKGGFSQYVTDLGEVTYVPTEIEIILKIKWTCQQKRYTDTRCCILLKPNIRLIKI